MTAYNVSHIGFLVHDLDAAIDRVGRTLRLRFLDPMLAEIPILEEGKATTTMQLRVSWSSEGPPHVELIEAQGEGLYSKAKGEGFHHLGTWEDDFDALFARLDGDRIFTEAVQRHPDRSVIASYTVPDNLYGLRLEFISGARRGEIDSWLRGDQWEA